MKEELMAWLQSHRDYADGVKLYERYGMNRVLKINFGRMNTELSRETLVQELGRLAGLTEMEVKFLPRIATAPSKTAVGKMVEKTLEDLVLDLADRLDSHVDEMFSLQADVETLSDEVRAELCNLKSKYAAIPDTAKNVIRFREKYPFLNEASCPNELKVLVADMFTAYDRYREEYLKLDPAKGVDENLEHAKTVVESYLENRAMWEELDYYLEHRQVLGKHPIFDRLKLEQDIRSIADIDLQRKLGNGKSNITKANNAIATAKGEDKLAEAKARLAKWTEYCELLEKEIAARKK